MYKDQVTDALQDMGILVSQDKQEIHKDLIEAGFGDKMATLIVDLLY